MLHKIPPKLLRERVTVDLVGAGGNGSQMLTGLARLHRAMLALGHPEGLHVRVIDPDTVSEANIGRQMFSPSDVGLPKATVLVHRINMFFGLNWAAHRATYQNVGHPGDIVIGCVDTAAARRSIATAVKGRWDGYWLDLGNEESTGQVVLGRWVKRLDKKDEDLRDSAARLPLVTELFPALLDKGRAESDAPTCSLAEALGRQDLFINQTVATLALNLLWRLFRTGTLDHHGYFVNLAQGRILPMPVDPAAWDRLRRPCPSRKGKPTKRGTRAAKAKAKPKRKRS